MMACTVPLLTESSSPLRICLPSTSTCRFLTSNRCIARLALSVLAVEVIGRRQAAEADIGCGLEVAVLHARGDGDLARIGIVHHVHSAPARNAEIAQILRAGVDQLVRLGGRWSGEDVDAANRQPAFAEAVLAFARYHEEQLVHHVMAVERKRLLAGRHDVDRATEPGQPEQRSHPSPSDRELLAVAA